jgi:hypothetical protein
MIVYFAQLTYYFSQTWQSVALSQAQLCMWLIGIRERNSGSPYSVLLPDPPSSL